MNQKHLVPRPPRVQTQYPIEAILKTLDTDKAYRMRLADRDLPTVVASLYRLLKRRGYQFRYRRRGSDLIAWAERRPEAAGPKRRKVTA